MVIVLVDGELDLSTGECVTKTKNGALNIAGLELLDQLLAMLAKTTEKICDHLAALSSLEGEVGEGSLDATSQVTDAALVNVARKA